MDDRCPICGCTRDYVPIQARQCQECLRIDWEFTHTAADQAAGEGVMTMEVTHEDLRAGRLNIYKLTCSEAQDLVAEYDRLRAENEQLRSELEAVLADRWRLAGKIDELQGNVQKLLGRE